LSVLPRLTASAYPVGIFKPLAIAGEEQTIQWPNV
jgi:hypothetical protein